MKLEDFVKCEKSLAELLSKYAPSGVKRDFLETCYHYRCRVNKEKRTMLVNFRSEHIMTRATLYELEHDVAEAYDLAACFFMPSYPESLFTPSYYEDLIRELSRNTTLANGFFDGGRMEIEDNHVKIILSNGLGKLPSESECKKILSDIVLEEFGKAVTFEIIDEKPFSMEEYVALSNATMTLNIKKEEPRDNSTTLFDNEKEEELPTVEGKSFFQSGFVTFDTTEPELFYGAKPKNMPEPISIKKFYTLKEKELCCVCGRVFFSEDRVTRAGDKTIASVQITDDTRSVTIKIVCANDKYKDAKD
ncbi:MAG: hypothetical protein IKV53_04060, partial [Clostridia bacterium]|nr:hypothetical protein [Clostridia bacterium]